MKRFNENPESQSNRSGSKRGAADNSIKITSFFGKRNIKFNENNPKYRKLKLQNTVFKNQVWNLNSARDFMLKSGWIKVDDELHFCRDENLWYIIDVLLEYRNVTPCTSEWQENTKVENLNISEKREEQLRAKAALERQKELEEYKKEKLYREQLAENVRKQIADDKQNRRLYVNSPPDPRNRQNPHYQIYRKLDS